MGKNTRGIWLAALAAVALLVVTVLAVRPAATVPATAAAPAESPTSESVSEPVSMEYEDLLFEATRVHTLDILVDDDAWTQFIQTCTDKEYIACDVVVDGGEVYQKARARGKRVCHRVSALVEFAA